MPQFKQAYFLIGYSNVEVYHFQSPVTILNSNYRLYFFSFFPLFGLKYKILQNQAALESMRVPSLSRYHLCLSYYLHLHQKSFIHFPLIFRQSSSQITSNFYNCITLIFFVGLENIIQSPICFYWATIGAIQALSCLQFVCVILCFTPKEVQNSKLTQPEVFYYWTIWARLAFQIMLKIGKYININQAQRVNPFMLMTLFKWQARILNKLYRTQRYDKLAQLQITNPEQINYLDFFDMTPGVNPGDYAKVIESTNKLCRPSTRALVMQQQVAFLNQFMKKLQTNQVPQPLRQQSESPVKKPQFTIQHVVIYSSLSKCRIWPKVLKSGIGFVPTLINFYNSFTKQYGDLLDFKFDPVILSQKYTKIMKSINMKKKDHPKLVEAVKKGDIAAIKSILEKLSQEYKIKQGINQQSTQQEKQQCSMGAIINNIAHKGLAISHICCQHSNLETIKYLHQIGTDFQILDVEKQTALFFAVKRSNLQIVRYLIEVVKVDLNHREYQDRTALYLAAFQGDLQVVDYLYKMGGDPELSSKLDRTPLSKACYLGNVKVVKYLLSIRVDPLKQDNKGRTALHNAVWGVEGGRDGKRRGHIMLEDSPECAQLLIQAGHPVDFEDYDGFTPFFSAVSSRAVRSMRLLIAHKANIHHKTKNKQNAVFIAAKYGHLEPMKILIDEYNLSYTEPDYHGYSPLCASITLQTSEAFLYLCSLYARNNIQIDIDKLVQCCRQYETTDNISYLSQWLMGDGAGLEKQKKIEYLAMHLDGLIENMKKLKMEKKKLKIDLQQVSKKRTKVYKQAAQKDSKGQKSQKTMINDLESKLNQQTYRQFSNVLQKQQQQQTQDQQLTPDPKQPATKQQNNLTTIITNINKQLHIIRKMEDKILQICANIAIKINSHSKIIKGDEEKIRSTAICLLATLVHVFNKGKRSELTDIVDYLLELAKIIQPGSASIPPILTLATQKQSQQQKSPIQQCKTLSHQLGIPLSEFATLKVCTHQPESQLIKLILNPSVLTNLTIDPYNMTETLFRLVRYRKTAVIIAMFNYRERIGGVGYQELLDIAMGKGVGETKVESNVEETKENKLNLIQYCIVHGISDIAVFLQQFCKSPQSLSLVTIPQYEIQRKQLTNDQCSIDLQPTDAWIFDLATLATKMTQKQKTLYKSYITNDPEPYYFQTCKNYFIVSTQPQLHSLRQALKQSILIGIDVEHYNISKQQYFVCSIQISNGEAVYIIDTLAHLQQTKENKINPEMIGQFMRQLMADGTKIKIFHAYQNDVRWIHQDFGLLAGGEKGHCNRNVIDTSKIYNLCNRIKKGQSIGLRTLCHQYLGYEMDKNFQRSDWRIRPLFKQMVQYAAIDAEVLPYVFLAMLVYGQKVESIQKFKQGFCLIRNIKSRGIRNTLIASQTPTKPIKQQNQQYQQTSQ